MKKIALIAALVAGTASVALAEDSSSSFGVNVYGQGTQQQVLINRNVAMTHGYATNQAPAKFDRAGNPYAGGGF
jgi:hypothetical protein